MLFCVKCGSELPSGASFCPVCGHAVEDGTRLDLPSVGINGRPMRKKMTALSRLARAMMFVGMGISAFAIFPLIWTIPMAEHYNRSILEGHDVSTAFKICSLILVSRVAGVLMLMDSKNNETNSTGANARI